MPSDPLPELYFATVRAMGTDLSAPTGHLSTTLTTAGYYVPDEVRLSRELRELDMCKRFLASGDESEYEQRNRLMTAGDAVRTYARNDAVALLAVRRLKELRKEATATARRRGMRGVAWMLCSLMHEAEVSTLRDLFGRHLFVISVFSEETRRTEVTRRQLGPSHNLFKAMKLDEQVDDLLARDQGRDYRYQDSLRGLEQRDPTLKVARLSIENTFYTADLFLDGDRDARTDIERFVYQIFGNPFGVATAPEVGMAHAFTAAQESSVISRRVGASLTVESSLICTGRNDIPKAGGGQQKGDARWTARDADAKGKDSGTSSQPREEQMEAADLERADIVTDLLTRLFRSPDWRRRLASHLSLDEAWELDEPHLTALLKETLELESVVKDSRIYDLIEFNPSVHAEMAAITTAARMGFSVAGGVLYTTTFPCHECTRHIVASGIKRVVYLEPYAKSRAEKLFAEQIRLSRPRGAENDVSRNQLGYKRPPVEYVPFMGIAPRRQPELFSWLRRKVEEGPVQPFHLDATSTIRESIEAPVAPQRVTPERAQARWRARLKDQELAVDAFAADLDLARGKMKLAFPSLRKART